MALRSWKKEASIPPWSLQRERGPVNSSIQGFQLPELWAPEFRLF